MAEYLYDERDLEFNLFEQIGIEDLFSRDRFKDLDREQIQLVLTEALKFTRKQIAPTNEIGDQVRVQYVDGQVVAPEAFRSVLKAQAEGGWIGLTSDPQYGGGGLPHVVGTAVGEMVCGANCALATFSGLTRGAAELLIQYGTDEMKERYAKRLLSGEWQGTMCLTEPGAGTAVGDSKSTAKPEGDHYLIQGTKIFISAGDHQFVDNVIHLVLAKTPGAPPGSKGLSIFLVPKIRVNDDGSLGKPNDVKCARIEHKMGIHGSPTCEMVFGENGACQGYLIGREFQGIEIMFMMMNDARIGVGLQGLSLGAAAYHLAREYAKQRVQGTRIEDIKDPTAPRVAIVEHPDVKRMLATQKAYTEAMRAMVLRTAYYLDWAENADTDEERETHLNLVELLTPIVKAYCTDTGFKVTELAIQTHGGYGYVGEYGVEQLCRDAKIGSIYEGTNGIQAMDLLGRKLAGKGGVRMQQYMTKVAEFIEANKSHPELGEEIKQLTKYHEQLGECAMTLAMRGQSDGPGASLFAATPLLRQMGNVTAAWLLLEQGVVATAKLKETPEGHADQTFYRNKIATAKFFTNHLLPENDYLAATVKSADLSAMAIEF